MMENGVGYSTFCTLLALNSLFLFCIAPCLTRASNQGQGRDGPDFDNIGGHQELGHASGGHQYGDVDKEEYNSG